MIGFIAQLDSFTLQVVASLVMLLTFLSALMLWLTLPAERYTRWWAGGNGMILAGLLAGALRERIPDLISIPLANALVAMGGVMIAHGVALFCERRGRRWSVGATGAAIFLTFCWLTFVHPSLGLRVVLMSLVFLLICVRMVWLLWRYAHPGIRIAQRVTAGLIALESGYYGAGLLGALVPDATQRYMDAPAAYNAVYLNSIIMFVCLIFAFTGLTNRRLQLRLERLARHDALTGALNRYALEAAADRELARSRRHGSALSVIALDVDHFKRINDNYGHAVGDEVLQAFADTLRGELRQEDALGRSGGEEFCVLLPHTGGDTAQRVAARLLAAVAAAPVPTSLGPVALTASAGVSTLDPAASASWSELLKAADDALYAAKRAGRNCVIAAPTGPLPPL